MLNFIEKLRAKPDHVKKNIAFFTSLGITMIIFVFWLASFNIISGVDKIGNNNLATKSRSPLSSLTASVGSIFGSIKDIFTGGNEMLYEADNSIEVLPKE